MKEEAPTKKLPPKKSSGGTGTVVATTPTKHHLHHNDEILSAMLRINNFDSISSIKDESLDIDLSACVTISADSAGMMNGNSLSSTDFWRVLDESAQNPQLDMTTNSSDGDVGGRKSSPLPPIDNSAKINCLVGSIKEEQPSSFSGTFLRPEPPTAPSFSPLKKNIVKALPAEQQQQRKAKLPAATRIEGGKKSKVSYAIKQELTQIVRTQDDANDNATSNSTKPISTSSFSLFMPLPIAVASALTISKTIATPMMQNRSLTSAQLPSLQPIQECAAAAEDVSLVASSPSPPQIPSLYKCLDCDGLLLQGPQELAAHELASHRILYRCGICERDFEQEAALKKHLKTHRSVEARKDAWKKCPDCGKCLKLGSMWMHRKIHSDNKKYGCDICGQKFVQKINLTHHSRVHTAEKPYECPECQKRFQERSHLQRHQKYHAQTRSYRCEKCGKMYKTERCLKVHNLVHLEQRPFACNVCEKSFISNSKLKQHSNIHTGERPFKCNYCPRDFTNFPNWLKHTRRRHKVDHKTGEHLENIPSYCSKKSAKTAKVVPKVEPIPMPELSAITMTSAPPPTLTTTTTKITAKAGSGPPPLSQSKTQNRRKKTTIASIPVPPLEALTIEPPPKDTKQPTAVAPVPTLNNNNNVVTIVGNSNATVKLPKVKRERKQLTPKQVQKQKIPSIVTSQLIKKEAQYEPQPTAGNNFPDLHCLSITSAEELIMEQALEMEECGLYDAPVSVVDTDNAISSSESAAALHFKIKNEFIVDGIKQEEFLSLNDVNSRVLCSSLESSPFSSPASASLELTSTSLTVPLTSSSTGTTTYYMPTYTLNSRGTLVTNLGSGTTISSHSDTASPSSLSSSLQLSVEQSHNSQQQLVQQPLLNHLYLPMVSMPLLQNQALPSVDTLLFSSHATASFFRRKAQLSQATAQHNLS